MKTDQAIYLIPISGLHGKGKFIIGDKGLVDFIGKRLISIDSTSYGKKIGPAMYMGSPKPSNKWYTAISQNGKRLRLHRAYLLEHSKPPLVIEDGLEVLADKVDHVNGNTYDCRRENLQWVTVKENNRRMFRRRS